MVASAFDPVPDVEPVLELRTAARTPVITTRRLNDIRADEAPGWAPEPWRASQHVLTLVTAGIGSQMIDFVWYGCRPGTLLWGWPGQVQQFGGEPGLDAVLLRFPPTVLADLALDWDPLDPRAPTSWQPTGEDEDAIVAEVAQIETDVARYSRGDLPERLLIHQLVVLLTRIMTLAPTGPRPAGDNGARPHRDAGGRANHWPSARSPERPNGPEYLVRRFRREIEQELRHRPVERYAELLGCSVRTLTRACITVTGQGAKQLVDERLALEAKRLLATTTLPATLVGQRLGFTEATNFGRFFSREAGQAPGAFRASLARRPPVSPTVVGPRSVLSGRLRQLPDPQRSSRGATAR